MARAAGGSLVTWRKADYYLDQAAFYAQAFVDAVAPVVAAVADHGGSRPHGDGAAVRSRRTVLGGFSGGTQSDGGSDAGSLASFGSTTTTMSSADLAPFDLTPVQQPRPGPLQTVLGAGALPSRPSVGGHAFDADPTYDVEVGAFLPTPHTPPSSETPSVASSNTSPEPGYTTGFIETSYGDVHYGEAGTRGDPLIIAMHGDGRLSCWHHWEQILVPFASRGFNASMEFR